MKHLIAIFFGVLIFTGCATVAPRCVPLRPYKITSMTIYPVVCPVEKMPKTCRHHDPNTIVNACAYRRRDMPNKCWIMAADSDEGKAAGFHEHSHCAGADENTARCSDWPGERNAPEGQFCDQPWPRGLGRE